MELARLNKVLKALAPVVQTLDSAIHRINHYPADKYLGNQLRYPLVEIYPSSSVIHLLNNWGQMGSFCTLAVVIFGTQQVAG